MLVEVHLRSVRRHPKKGTYWSLRWTMDGVRDQETLGYLSEADAEALRVRKEALLRLGSCSPLTPSEPRVEDLARDYLVHVDETRPGSERYRKAELTWALQISEHVGDELAATVSEVTVRQLIARYRAEAEAEGWAPKRNTLLALTACFRRILNHALDLGKLTRPPPRLPTGVLSDDARPPRELSQAEVLALIVAARDHVGESYARLIEFCAWCPRRPVALFALTRAHVRSVEDGTPRKDARIWIERDKAGIGRGWTPLTDPAIDALSVQLVELGKQSPAELVWPAPWGGAYTSSTVQRQLKQAAEIAGVVDVTFYDLRKFGCTQIYAESGDLRLVQRFSGHKDIATLVRRYIYARPGAAEALAQRVGWDGSRGQNAALKRA